MDEEKKNVDTILEHNLNEKKKLNDRINQLTVIGKKYMCNIYFSFNCVILMVVIYYISKYLETKLIC